MSTSRSTKKTKLKAKIKVTKTKVNEQVRVAPAAMARTKLTPQKIQKFLDNVALGLPIVDAAQQASTTHVTLYRRRLKDPKLAEQWDEAYKQGTAVLEQEAQRRAVVGYLEPVFYQGKQIAQVRKFSDILLIFLLKARDPRFKDRVDVTSGDQPITASFTAAVRRVNERNA